MFVTPFTFNKRPNFDILSKFSLYIVNWVIYYKTGKINAMVDKFFYKFKIKNVAKGFTKVALTLNGKWPLIYFVLTCIYKINKVLK